MGEGKSLWANTDLWRAAMTPGRSLLPGKRVSSLSL